VIAKMTVARLYRMEAALGKSTELEAALTALATVVRSISGCRGVELLRDVGSLEQFVFIEKWESIKAHEAARSQLPKAVLGPMMAALAGAPMGAYLNYILNV
jgi:heme oxygenase (mycobilin-producing)